MRVKKQKRHRKVVRFYTACFGFREPFKVLCDGTFIHHLLVHRLTPADDVLAHLLGARTLLFSTGCVNAELRALGESHKEAFQAAQQLVTARCDHEKRVNAALCIEAVIADGNPEHFFVATQDADLRRKLSEIPGVPVIYGVKNSLFIDKPSSKQHEFVKSSEEKRLHISDMEARLLHKRKIQEAPPPHGETEPNNADDDLGAISSLGETAKNKNRKKALGVIDKCQFKRKRAKGPNPLSCKKKKVKENHTVSHNQDGGTDDGAKRKRTRKRKKSKDGKLADRDNHQ